LNETDRVSNYLTEFKADVWQRLEGLHTQLIHLKNEGFEVDCIAPQAAIYLTVKFGLLGKTTANGQKLTNAEEIAYFLINEAGVAVVPFYAFGGSRTSAWFRISVGTIRVSDCAEIGSHLKRALNTLT
jgi:aspartate aminotransferase